MAEKIDCPSCKSTNIKEYKNLLTGAILVLLMFPLGVMYMILTPKYRCKDCKTLFLRFFSSNKKTKKSGKQPTKK